MKLSVNEIATMLGVDRATVLRRAEALGIEFEHGPHRAKLFQTREIMQLVPVPLRSSTAHDDATLEEAKIRQTMADAEVKELTAQKLKGNLADVGEVMEAQNDILDQVLAIIKKSAMSDNDKEDCLSSISKAARIWDV